MILETLGFIHHDSFNHINIKDSRETRLTKLETKNKYHKKNPKSIEFHENKKLSEPQVMTIKEKTVNAIQKSKQKPLVSSKIKNHLQLMFNTLVKSYKREGVFFTASKNFESIQVMKDYNVNINVLDANVQVCVRGIVVNFTEFKDFVLKNSGNFSLLKSHIGKLIFDSQKNYNPKIEVESKINALIEQHKTIPHIKNFIPSLVSKMIAILKKPNKQPNGFEERISQVNSSWLEEVQEIYHIECLENELNFKLYEQSFPLARSMKRKFSIFIGKTNSGKTYEALNELAKGINGVYLAPLRLMAQEGQESLSERGVLTSLLTGEEQQILEDASHVSSTVEMCNMTKMIDVAVIDEIQTISDESRGWAWSQALVGVPAKHVILVGSEEALPYIIPILKHLGEEYEIREFERKTPLEIHNSIWKLQNLKAGDCVVVFSRKAALEMKNSIEATGKKCSVIYGNLSPDVRRMEAQKFKNGENQILVATDAIGMGLNLPISRLFFSTMEKYDGIETRYLNTSEIKQIAGRAGRYGFANIGEVGILFNDSHFEKTLLHKAIYGGYDAATDTRVPVGPNLQHIKTICDTLGKNDLYSALIFFKEKLIRDNPLYKAANLDSIIELASIIKNKKLDLSMGLNYSCVPVDINSEVHNQHYHIWLNNHLAGRKNFAPELPDVIDENRNDSYSLYEAEIYVKLVMAYRWFHYKYPETYPDLDIIIERAKITNDYIEKSLHSHIIINSSRRRK